MKVIIAGSRSFKDYQYLETYCDILIPKSEDVEIVCGMAKGADRLGKMYAKQSSFKVVEFPANWDKYGKRAGYLRNKEMAEYSDMLIVFWNGQSRGTKHMIDLANEAGLDVYISKF